MQLNLSKEDIETFVKETLLKSSIGNIIEEALRKVTDTKGNYYDKDSIIDLEMKKFVANFAAAIIREQYTDTVKNIVDAKIKEKLSASLVEDIADKLVSKMLSKIDEERW